ncbi:MAG TPA: hypothetical protein VF195_06585 [Actinomycetota bacterium]
MSFDRWEVIRKRRSLRVLAPFLLLLAACASDEGLSSGGAATSECWFESLPRMVATSDVVVLGTVVEIQKDVMLGTPPEEIYLLHADLDLEETLYGSDVPSPLTVQTDQDVPTEPEWRQVGNTVLAFMKFSTDPNFPGVYYPGEPPVRLSRGGNRPTGDSGG